MGRIAAPVSNARELALYFGLAYGISLVLWLAALRGWIPLAAGTFGPTLAAITAHRIIASNWRAFRLWTSLPRMLIGAAAGCAAVLIAAFSAAFLMTRSGMDRWQWSALLQIVTLYGPNLLGGPLGEEAGWRGFALPRLQQRFTPVVSSLILGFVWANWHLPLFFAHVYNVTWWQFVLLTMAASVFLSLGFNLSRGSTITAILIHGIYNVGTGVILNDFIGKAELRTNEAQHNILWLAYGGVALLICISTRGRLGCRKNEYRATSIAG
jgi:membrane protease YdiL (CAAX protease family)